MEKIKSFFRSFKPWQIVLITLSLTAIASVAIIISTFLRTSAGIKLGSASGLVLTADRQDEMGMFTDSTFTLKSDTDLSISGVKNSLAFFPETEFEVNQISPRQFSITPRTPLKDNSLYRIKILADQKTFSWAFQTKNDFRVVQSLPRNKATYVPLNTGIEISFSHPNFEDVDKYFEIYPKVEGRFERHFRTVSFVPQGLKPDTLYTVKVKKGVKLNGTSDILKEDYTFQFETQSSDQGRNVIGFSKSFYEFSVSETPAFDIYSYSAGGSSLGIKVYKFSSNQSFLTSFTQKIAIPLWASNSQRHHKVDTSSLSKVLDFSATVQSQNYTKYFLFPQTLTKGYYLVEADQGGGVTTQAFVQISDISAYTTVSGTKTLVWVNSVGSGTPINGAQVTFQSKTQTTGSDGVAYFDTPNNTIENTELLSIVSSGDTLYLPIQSELFYFDSESQNVRRQSNKYWSYFYSDRPVYLPSDTVRFWGLLRDRDNLKAKQKFTLEVTKSDYFSWNFNQIVLYSKEFDTTDLGTFIGDIPLTNFNTGYYNIALKKDNIAILNSGFSVETYNKPAYQIDLDVSKPSMIVGETVKISGKTSFFEGSPVPGMSLKYSHSGSSGSITTDSLGGFNFDYSPTPGSISNYYSPEYRYFTVTPSNPEEGYISGNISIPVFNSSYVFNYGESSVEGGSANVMVDLRQVDTSKFKPGSSLDTLSPASGKNIKGELVEVAWEKRQVGTYYDFINKTTSPQYEYDRVESKIADISLSSDSSGKANYSFSTQDKRTYLVKLEATDDQGRTASQTYYVSSYPDYYSQNNFIYLKTDKTGTSISSYNIGEEVNLTVMQGDAPVNSSDKDKFIYLFAQRGLKTYQLSDHNSLGFKFSDNFVPNIFVRAIRFTGKTYQVSETINLIFNTAPRKLSLSVIGDKENYLPGSEARLTISAKDADNSPVRAEVNLSLIDEAYTSLFSNFTDPLSRIYSSVNADIIASYQSHRYPLGISGAEGGGCFLPGTSILMSDGTTKNIEDVKIGDKVRTLAKAGSSKTESAEVVQTFKHEISGYILINNHLRVTEEHNLYINGRWMTAGEVRVGDYYLDSKNNYRAITSVEKYSGVNRVYNLEVAKYHTYLADGFYVHNDKGRDLFVDNAYFGSVNTGLDGKAEVSFKLPDNLTSWIITAQGVTEDLKVGSQISTLTVKQNFFVDAIMNAEYLVSDKPSILVRSYGEGLTSDSPVAIKVESDTLGINKTVNLKAFESAQIDLGALKEGSHRIKITGSSASMTDSITRNMNVVRSRLKSVNMSSSVLSPESKPQGSSDSMTTLTFSDLSLGRFYPPLLNFSYGRGDRLDQKLSRKISQELIIKYFDDTLSAESINFAPYSVPGNGYAIYPYASSDTELSAYVAALASDKIDKVGLANYFYEQISNVQDDVTFAQSLFGLASLEEPILVLINNFGQSKNLTPIARIYHALSLAKIGDTENALLLFSQIVGEFGKTQDQLRYLNIGNKDQNLQATALAAALASLVSPSEANALLAYTYTNSSKDLLLISPQIMAIQNLLESEKPQDVSFAYTLNGKKHSIALEKGKTFKVELSPSDLSTISFSDISGSVGLVSHFLAPVDPDNFTKENSVQIGRTYSVDGKITNSFSSSDLVKVSLPFKFTETSQDGCYQVSDLLPSGLRAVSAVYQYGISDPQVWYPYEINGQKVSFCVGKSSLSNSIVYYARVVSAGEYKAENAIIQSLISPSVQSLSPSGTVDIR